MKRLFVVLAMVLAVPLALTGCAGGATAAAPSSTPTASSSAPAQPTGRATPRPAPVGAPTGKHADYCAHNQDPACPAGSYKGPHVAARHGGHWNAQGHPVNGGPVGADGSTGNNLTQESCARTEDPGCPVGSYVGPGAIPNPDGSNTYVECEGTICTNPNHGGG